MRVPRRGMRVLAHGALLLLLLAGATCTGVPRAEERTAENPEEDTLAYVDGEDLWMEEEPIADEYRRLGLTGANKPNGMDYRLRQSVPQATPHFLPRHLDGLELFIADPAPEGWLGFYREPLQRMETPANPRFRALLFGEEGERLWDLDLNRFLSRPDHLEIQDVRYQEGELYFNEACQSYSREAGGRCSSLVRVDPARQEVEWRTPPRTSNNIFILHGPHVIAGYGFTAEPDSLFWIRRETGEIVTRRRLDSAHSYLEIREGDLVVVTHSGRVESLPAEPERPR